MQEARDVGARRKLQSKSGVLLGSIISVQPLADIVRAHAHAGVRPRVVVRSAAKQGYPDKSFFELVEITAQRMVDNVAEKLATFRTRAELRACADALNSFVQRMSVAGKVCWLEFLFVHEQRMEQLDSTSVTSPHYAEIKEGGQRAIKRDFD